MEVLNLRQVGLDDRFLNLGGDSILATQVVSRIRARLGVELSLLTFLNAGTLSELVGAVELLQVGKRIVEKRYRAPSESFSSSAGPALA